MAVDNRDIVDYWARREDECGLGVDWADAETRCWRCGCEAKLQRCHIVPKSRGGTFEPSNLVLLCSPCHGEAPNMSDPRYMWIWLRATGVPFYNTFWAMRVVQQYVTLFDKAPFEGMDSADVSVEEMKPLLDQVLHGVAAHFGEGRWNVVTIACAIHQVEQIMRAGMESGCVIARDDVYPDGWQ